MKIAVTYLDGSVFQHFGHTEYFKIYTVENNAVTDSEVIETNGHGHGGTFQSKHRNGGPKLPAGLSASG